jgi:DNA polymerase I-like protein with 3'-5' exonuclease and polymerase domains
VKLADLLAEKKGQARYTPLETIIGEFANCAAVGLSAEVVMGEVRSFILTTPDNRYAVSPEDRYLPSLLNGYRPVKVVRDYATLMAIRVPVQSVFVIDLARKLVGSPRADGNMVPLAGPTTLLREREALVSEIKKQGLIRLCGLEFDTALVVARAEQIGLPVDSELLRSTPNHPLAAFVSPDDGRVHPHWHVLGTETGRITSTAPNIQGLQASLRPAVKPAQGRLLIHADYAQQEMRIIASLSQDQELRAIFSSGADPYMTLAQTLVGENATPDDRKQAKAMCLGLCYMMGDGGIVQQAETRYGLKLTLQDAADFRAAFFGKFPGVAAWQQAMQAQYKKTGYAVSAVGRRRQLGDKAAPQVIVNTPVQSTAADMLKVATTELFKKLPADAHIVLFHHDALLVECAERDADKVANLTQTTMEKAEESLLAKVPGKAETKILTRWV